MRNTRRVRACNVLTCIPFRTFNHQRGDSLSLAGTNDRLGTLFLFFWPALDFSVVYFLAAGSTIIMLLCSMDGDSQVYR